MNELLILFNFVCSSSPFTIDQAACTRAMEAYSIQIGLDKKAYTLEKLVKEKFEKTIKINPLEATLAYTVGQYALNKKASMTIPIKRNVALSIKGTESDKTGSIGVTVHF